MVKRYETWRDQQGSKEATWDAYYETAIKMLNLVQAGVLHPSDLSVGITTDWGLADGRATPATPFPESRLGGGRRIVHVDPLLFVPSEDGDYFPLEAEDLKEFLLRAIEHFHPTTNEDAALKALLLKGNPKEDPGR